MPHRCILFDINYINYLNIFKLYELYMKYIWYRAVNILNPFLKKIEAGNPETRKPCMFKGNMVNMGVFL